MGLSSGNVVGDVLKKLQIYGERFPSQLPFKDEGDVTEKLERMLLNTSNCKT